LVKYIDLAEISPPSSPGADVGRLYAKDVAGVTKLAFRDHAGTETVLGSGSGGSSAGHSLLHNPDFRIATRGTSFTSAGNFPNNDGAYLLDGAVLLSDGNNVANVDQELTTVPLGAYAAAKVTVATANKKFGFLFPIEARDARQIIGGTASLSFKARKGGSNATLGSLRAAIISWSGTEDVITRDVVSGTSWGAAGTNPTLAANWTYENTPSNLALTTSYQEFKIENVAIDTASAKNVGVFIWTDDTNATVNDIVYLTDINLVPGAVATSYMPRAFAQQRVMCGRFLPHWRADGASFNIIALGYSDSSTNTFAAVPFFTPARVAVAGAVVSAAGDFRVRASPGGTVTPTAITFNQGGVHACLVNITLASGSTAGFALEFFSNTATPGAYLIFTGAEL
jgi:hypothetical protein